MTAEPSDGHTLSENVPSLPSENTSGTTDSCTDTHLSGDKWKELDQREEEETASDRDDSLRQIRPVQSRKMSDQQLWNEKKADLSMNSDPASSEDPDTSVVSSQNTEEEGSLSPDVWEDEGPPPPPPKKLSLHRSKTKVKTQSKEDHQLSHDNHGFQDDNDQPDKTPIVVFLSDPLEIQSSCNRLSTIFESEEDLPGLLAPESDAAEDATKREEPQQEVPTIPEPNAGALEDVTGSGENQTSADVIRGDKDQSKADLLGDSPTKRKFKFKFPKNKLAAIRQVIRSGTPSTAGKKSPEVVVCEEEEETAVDVRTTKERSRSRMQQLCRSTFDSMDSLEVSIKQLEISLDSVMAPSSPSPAPDSCGRGDRAEVRRERERSPSKRPAALKSPNPPQSKRSKPQPPHDAVRTSRKQVTRLHGSFSSVVPGSFPLTVCCSSSSSQTSSSVR